jgi:hypothetical protein
MLARKPALIFIKATRVPSPSGHLIEVKGSRDPGGMHYAATGWPLIGETDARDGSVGPR